MASKKTKKLRILFCWFEHSKQQQALQYWVSEQKPEFTGLVADSNHLGNDADFFLPACSAQKADSYDANLHRYVPSKQLIEDLRPIEAEVLRMMDRTYSSPFKGRQYEFRKRQYYSLLCLAYGFLEKHDFTTVVWSQVPQDSFDFILYGLCQQMGIKTIIFHQLPIGKHLVWSNSITTLFDELKPDDSFAHAEKADLSEKIEKELQPWLNTTNISSTRENLRSSKSFSSIFHSLLNWRAHKKLPKSSPQKGASFVFFPLQLHPDPATTPFGGLYAEQEYAIISIARALPQGVALMVQEHPYQEFWQRSRSFYNVLSEEPNIQFTHRNHDRRELIEKCIAVATLADITGWHALLKGKPVLLLGNAFYQHLPSVFRTSCPHEIKSTIENIQSGKFTPCTLSDIRTFLHQLHDNSRILSDNYSSGEGNITTDALNLSLKDSDNTVDFVEKPKNPT